MVLVLPRVMYFINYVVRVSVSTAAADFQPELHLTNTCGPDLRCSATRTLFQIIGDGSAIGSARKALTFFATIWSAATVYGTHQHVGRYAGCPRPAGDRGPALPTATRAMSD